MGVTGFPFEWLSERVPCMEDESGVLGPHLLGTKPRLRPHEVPHCLRLLGDSCPAADPLLGPHSSAGSEPLSYPLSYPHTFLACSAAGHRDGDEVPGRLQSCPTSHCRFSLLDATLQSHLHYLNPLLWVWLSLSSLEISDFPGPCSSSFLRRTGGVHPAHSYGKSNLNVVFPLSGTFSGSPSPLVDALLLRDYWIWTTTPLLLWCSLCTLSLPWNSALSHSKLLQLSPASCL